MRVVEIFNDEFRHEVYQVMEYVEGQEILDEISANFLDPWNNSQPTNAIL